MNVDRRTKHTEVNQLINPAFHRVRGVIMKALKGHNLRRSDVWGSVQGLALTTQEPVVSIVSSGNHFKAKEAQQESEFGLLLSAGARGGV